MLPIALVNNAAANRNHGHGLEKDRGLDQMNLENENPG
jgi:hypothetical protein